MKKKWHSFRLIIFLFYYTHRPSHAIIGLQIYRNSFNNTSFKKKILIPQANHTWINKFKVTAKSVKMMSSTIANIDSMNRISLFSLWFNSEEMSIKRVVSVNFFWYYFSIANAISHKIWLIVPFLSQQD